MKKGIVIGMCILLILGMGGSGFAGYYLGSHKKADSNISEGVTFDTPEDCILQFFKGLKKGDAKKMIECFATDTSGEGFDFEGYSERMNSLYFGRMGMLPTNDDFFVELNQREAQGAAVGNIKGLVISLLLDRDLKGFPTFLLESTDEIGAVEEEFDIARLEDVKVLEIYKIELVSERAIKNYEKAAEVYGHELLDEYMVAFEFEGDTYTLGMTLCEDEDRFSINGLQASFVGTNGTGFAVPMEEDSLEDVIPEVDEVYEPKMIYENK